MTMEFRNVITQPREYIFKILVIGELGAGKTSIIKRYVHQFFSNNYKATIGVDFALKIVELESGGVVRLQLWDIAGQERFGSMTRVYYRDAAAAFVVFDLTRVATLEAAVKWKRDLDEKVSTVDGTPVPAILLGNKCDLPREAEMPSDSDISQFCTKHGFIGWRKVSAKDGNGIEEAADEILKTLVSREEHAGGGRPAVLQLHETLEAEPTSSKCCG